MTPNVDPQEEAAKAPRSLFPRAAMNFDVRAVVARATLVLILWLVAFAALGATVTYVRTATVTRCHSRHILGFIPDGTACVTTHRF
jgi:hypothetical protein